MTSRALLYPFLATMVAIALLSLMDVFMKSAAIAVGAFSALLLRNGIGVLLTAPAWLATRKSWPSRRAMRLHLTRGCAVTFMALTFFSALVLLPLAEAIALSFIAPLIALGLAALILKERIERRAIIAALLGLAGIGVILAGRIGAERMTDDAALGIVLVLVSAVVYAWNLVLQRQQALAAKPLEIATFQASIVTLILLLGAPWWFALPDSSAALDIAMAAVLGVAGMMTLAWAYARAEAQVLVPVEYTGFLWAALFGWLFFAEAVRGATVAGAVLIVIGCWIGAPRKRPEQAAL